MFRTPYPRYVILLLLMFFVSGPGLSGQVPEHEVPELKQRAANHFEAGDFAGAGAAYEKLIRQFPRDAMYRYYAGICKVEQGIELEAAVELLYYASTRGVPEDVYYYLGEAYRKMYDFERAKKYYIAFDTEAPRSMARERDSKLLIRSVNTAVQLTASYNPYQVQHVTFINLHDPEQATQIRMKGGELSRKPEVFFSEQEDREDLNAWMFMPKDPVRGQKVFFSGFERRGKDGFQIMRAVRGNTGKWNDIQPVEALNTAGDEILPYFDPVGKDLYFASNGREGIGGFDLYRSHYDEERDAWSEPVSLGFPVNSAFDDYLLLPGADLGMVTFFTARQTNDTAVAVYRVHLSEPKQSLASRSPQEIRRIANLDNAASKMMEEFEAYKDFIAMGDKGTGAAEASTTGESRAGAGSGSLVAHRKESGAVQDQLRSAEAADPAYQALITAALKHQAASDSLTELYTSARIRVRESDDPNEKWLSQRQIMVWEKKSAEEQEQADVYFAQVAGYQKPAAPSAEGKEAAQTERTAYRLVDNATTGATGSSGQGVSERAKAAFSSGDQQEEVRAADVPPRNQSDQGSGVSSEGELLQPVAGRDAGNRHSAEPANRLSEPSRQASATGTGVPGPADKAPRPANPGSAQMQAAVSQRFELLDASPYGVANPIPVDEPLPQGTLYRIQMGVFSSEVDPGVYGGIVPISAMTDTGRNLVFYYAGSFQYYEEARDALDIVRSEGFADAFIVSWYNGAKMSVEKARKLE